MMRMLLMSGSKLSELSKQRVIAMNARRRPGKRSVSCDLCRIEGHTLAREAIEYHHLYPRSLTLGNPAARALSHHHTVCAVLCQECHQKAHTYPALQEAMLEHNRLLFGEQPVNEQISMIRMALELR